MAYNLSDRSISKTQNSKTQEELIAAQKSGELFSGDDLYSILQRASSAAGTPDDFCSKVESSLDGILGENNYGVVILYTSGQGMNGDSHGGKINKQVYWSGTSGILPGLMGSHGVFCTVILS